MVSSSDAVQSGADKPRPCSALALQSDVTLTLKQRACLYTKEITAPKFALAASFAAAFGQFANSPRVPREHWQEFPHRLEVYYARHAGQDAGELLAGYLHHEDPRARLSNAHGFVHRADWAFMSVLTSPDADGHLRLAYAPIAGSFSSAFVGSAMYRHSETINSTMAHVGFVYGHYFMRAFIAEFKPELTAYARHLLHRDR